MRLPKFFKAGQFVFLGVVMAFILLSLSPYAFSKNSSQKLVLKARLFTVEAFSPESVVDALDLVSAAGAMPTARVSFLVKDVVKGELPLQTRSGNSGSLSSQAKDAVKERDFLKLVTMDFENPDVEHLEKARWFSVGVQSPLESFKVISWKDLPAKPYKLTFSKEPDSAGWILQSAELD